MRTSHNNLSSVSSLSMLCVTGLPLQLCAQAINLACSTFLRLQKCRVFWLREPGVDLRTVSPAASSVVGGEAVLLIARLAQL